MPSWVVTIPARGYRTVVYPSAGAVSR